MSELIVGNCSNWGPYDVVCCFAVCHQCAMGLRRNAKQRPASNRKSLFLLKYPQKDLNLQPTD